MKKLVLFGVICLLTSCVGFVGFSGTYANFLEIQPGKRIMIEPVKESEFDFKLTNTGSDNSEVDVYNTNGKLIKKLRSKEAIAFKKDEVVDIVIENPTTMLGQVHYQAKGRGGSAPKPRIKELK